MLNYLENFSARARIGTYRSRRWRFFSDIAKQRDFKFALVIDQALRAGLFKHNEDALDYYLSGGIKFFNRRKRFVQMVVLDNMFAEMLKYMDASLIKNIQDFLEVQKYFGRIRRSMQFFRMMFGDLSQIKDPLQAKLTTKGQLFLGRMFLANGKWRKAWKLDEGGVQNFLDMGGLKMVEGGLEMVILLQQLDIFIKKLRALETVDFNTVKHDIGWIIDALDLPAVNTSLFGLRPPSVATLRNLRGSSIRRAFLMSLSLFVKARSTFALSLPISTGKELVLQLTRAGIFLFQPWVFLEKDLVIRQDHHASKAMNLDAANIPADAFGAPTYKDPKNTRELLEGMATDWYNMDKDQFRKPGTFGKPLPMPKDEDL